jgi:hypothetical protein
VAIVGAVFALVLIPAQPPQPSGEAGKTAYAMSEKR